MYKHLRELSKLFLLLPNWSLMENVKSGLVGFLVKKGLNELHKIRSSLHFKETTKLDQSNFLPR